jgi:hypothetical protein
MIARSPEARREQSAIKIAAWRSWGASPILALDLLGLWLPCAQRLRDRTPAQHAH